MKAIIWIIILALIAGGVWWFMKDDATPGAETGYNAAEVQGASDASLDTEVDLGQFESKG